MMKPITKHCEVCETPLVFPQWRRCDEHKRCDTCGTNKQLCFYTEGIFCQTCWSQYVKELIANFYGSTEYSDVPICPHCGYRLDDWWDMSWESDNKEVSCSRCERDYEIKLLRIYEFSTKKSEVKQ